MLADEDNGVALAVMTSLIIHIAIVTRATEPVVPLVSHWSAALSNITPIRSATMTVR